MDRPVPIPVLSAPSNPQGLAKTAARQALLYSTDSMVAVESVVYSPGAMAGDRYLHFSNVSDLLYIPEQARSSSEADSMADPSLSFSAKVHNILLNSRKASTCSSYAFKWKVSLFLRFVCVKFSLLEICLHQVQICRLCLTPSSTFGSRD